MHRILVVAPLVAGHELVVPDEEAHHLRVRRASAGDAVEVLDGRGSVATGILVIRGREWAAFLDQVAAIPLPSPLVLMVGAGDRDRFAWLVEKSVELGVTELIPLETERSAQVATRIREGQRDKLTRRALEALKQCGGAWSLSLREPVPIAAAVHDLAVGTRWLADPGGQPARGLATDAAVAIAVGPEGGFTDLERDQLVAAGFEPTRLGPRILRFETAALAAATLAAVARKERA